MSIQSEREARQELAGLSQTLHDRGWVANHDGNITARLGSDRYLATPTAVSKRRIGPRDVIVVDAKGKHVSGAGKPFSELNLHLAVYQARPDVGAVLHSHSPYATALACAGSRVLEKPFMPEAVVSIGPSIPLVPFAPPGPNAAAQLADYVSWYDGVLLEGHGVLSWGPDLELAYLRMELIEHLARIATLAAPLGGVKPLSPDVVSPLVQKRRKSGLGLAAERCPEYVSTAGQDPQLREQIRLALGKNSTHM